MKLFQADFQPFWLFFLMCWSRLDTPDMVANKGKVSNFCVICKLANAVLHPGSTCIEPIGNNPKVPWGPGEDG